MRVGNYQGLLLYNNYMYNMCIPQILGVACTINQLTRIRSPGVVCALPPASYCTVPGKVGYQYITSGTRFQGWQGIIIPVTRLQTPSRREREVGF